MFICCLFAAVVDVVDVVAVVDAVVVGGGG